MRKYIIELKANKKNHRSIGNKASGLCWLMGQGCQVPRTFICLWEAHSNYLDGDIKLLNKIRAELEFIISPEKLYSVRSSSNVEDDSKHSFAGQFSSFLNIQDVDGILESILSIWEDIEKADIGAYLKGVGLTTKDVKMAVIVQEMVNPVFSGVSFSRNPITTFDEVVIEAVQGNGEQLMQEGVTPMRWINKWGNWLQKEDCEMPQDLAEKIVEDTIQISKKRGVDVDLEWVFDGRQLNWVQVRDISTLDEVRIYNNRLSKEHLPGLIKPLVWSVNIPLTNGEWVSLISEVLGNFDIEPTSLARAFHYRAYYDMGAFGRILNRLGLPRESLEIIMGIQSSGPRKPSMKPGLSMLPYLPKIAIFIAEKWGLAPKFQRDLQEITRKQDEILSSSLNQLSPYEIIQQLDQFYPFQQKATYYNIVVALAANIYNSILKARFEAVNVDYQMLNLTEGLSELEKFDPNASFQHLNTLWKQLSSSDQDMFLEHGLYGNAGCGTPVVQQFVVAAEQFLAQFGYMSDSGNDFSYSTWEENPKLILSLIASFQGPAHAEGHKTRFEDIKMRGPGKWIAQLFYHKARNYLLYREQISTAYIRGVNIFRKYYLTLADWLVEQGLLEFRDDIFYLYDAEIRGFSLGDLDGVDFSELVTQRKNEMALCNNIQLPDVIFDDAPPLVAFNTHNKLRGTPTSRGFHTGKAKIIKSLQDFHLIETGDVLVVPFSDVSWTPLYAKAGAVVSESGGILSHSSIIAREYNIPAVVSVSGAMQIQSGIEISVDGFSGEILIHD